MSLLVVLGLVALGITVIFTLYSVLQVDDLEGVLAGKYDVKPEAVRLPEKVYMSKNEGIIIITDMVVAEYMGKEAVVVNPVLTIDSFKKYLAEECVEVGEL